ncbi:MAG: cell division protein FtsZ [Bacteroidales bacterium]|nr:cell division protein FtsZ [Bacteroidales bacterium]
MPEELINFDLPLERSSIIKVIGVGGGGSNAVNYMYQQGIKDVNFVICNTDAQATGKKPCWCKNANWALKTTQGLGAGNKPETGRQAALETIEELNELLSKNTKMVFITAGMGGGTGTGAAPVIAQAAKELGLLTVAIVTIPFQFEGAQRLKQAVDGIKELQEHVDSLLIISNEKLREIYGNLKLGQAFAKADNILATAAKGIAEMITVSGYINVDFADVQTVMTNSGVALMGSGIAEGENRALLATQQALSSPLLNNNDITGAKSVLLNITYGTDEISMDEVGQITDYISSSLSREALVIWGAGMDEQLGNQVNVTIIATGFNANSVPELNVYNKEAVLVDLYDSHHISTSGLEFKVVDKKGSSIELDPNPYQKKLEFGPIEQDNGGFVVYNSSRIDAKNDIHAARKATERIKTLQKSTEKIKDAGLAQTDERANIDKLELIPAYQRRNVNIDVNIPLSRIAIFQG